MSDHDLFTKKCIADLYSCPFCGKKDAEITDIERSSNPEDPSFELFMTCEHCDSSWVFDLAVTNAHPVDEGVLDLTNNEDE